MLLRTTCAALAALVLLPAAARAAESYDNCTGFIDSLPATISTQGTWCLRRNLSTAMAAGSAVSVSTHNVTIDCNDFELGNLEAGTATAAIGIQAISKMNVTVRHCNVRGFFVGIELRADVDTGVYAVEDNRVEGSTGFGISVGGDGTMVRRNAVSNIGGSTLVSPANDRPAGIAAGNGAYVIDNTVTDVVGQSYTHGIYTFNSTGGAVIGNRVSGVMAGVGQTAYGIRADAPAGQIIRDNDIRYDDIVAAGYGLSCSAPSARARDNIIRGFATGIAGCADAGGNDVVTSY